MIPPFFQRWGISGFASHFDAKEVGIFHEKNTAKRDPMRPAPLLRFWFPSDFSAGFFHVGGFYPEMKTVPVWLGTFSLFVPKLGQASVITNACGRRKSNAIAVTFAIWLAMWRWGKKQKTWTRWDELRLAFLWIFFTDGYHTMGWSTGFFVDQSQKFLGAQRWGGLNMLDSSRFFTAMVGSESIWVSDRTDRKPSLEVFIKTEELAYIKGMCVYTCRVYTSYLYDIQLDML